LGPVVIVILQFKEMNSRSKDILVSIDTKIMKIGSNLVYIPEVSGLVGCNQK
jgi:hypothetical protein